tara:strand:- start:172 stop:312 length:141 start_codon:yes stop_codon:yes gene_type:complete
MAQQSTSGLGVAHPVQYSPIQEKEKKKEDKKKNNATSVHPSGRMTT